MLFARHIGVALLGFMGSQLETATDVIVNAIVNAMVIDILIVAALVSGNDAVDLIDIVLDQASISLINLGTIRSVQLGARSILRLDHARPLPVGHGVDQVYGVVPAHERGHDQGDRSRSRYRRRASKSV